MCLGAIYWARPSAVYYAATHQDAARAGFDDSFIYREIELSPARRTIPMIHTAEDSAPLPFNEWNRKADRLRY
jgi:guanine deaminase